MSSKCMGWHTRVGKVVCIVTPEPLLRRSDLSLFLETAAVDNLGCVACLCGSTKNPQKVFGRLYLL